MRKRGVVHGMKPAKDRVMGMDTVEKFENYCGNNALLVSYGFQSLLHVADEISASDDEGYQAIEQRSLGGSGAILPCCPALSGCPVFGFIQFYRVCQDDPGHGQGTIGRVIRVISKCVAS